ncbi:Protein red1 [Neolecta irregularis DAH-3]|uniref:Protein red1 n=1 Tax=Neolecta irregularis (strain DAH-3) TaxID=1198029 RepID=A0A1U7LSM7_NEOID|nr:Protein red1 [Neolecta irregularis DAH-3]|eukprot:OLL25618.1 Protein red1 [Neolecta irregularis DAH-3]
MVALFPQEPLPQNGGLSMDLTSLRMAALQSKKNQNSLAAPHNASDAASEREEGEISDADNRGSPPLPETYPHYGLCQKHHMVTSNYKVRPKAPEFPGRIHPVPETQTTPGRSSALSFAIKNKKQAASVAVAELIKLGLSFSDLCSENVHPEALIDILRSLNVPESYYLVSPPRQTIPVDEIEQLIHSERQVVDLTTEQSTPEVETNDTNDQQGNSKLTSTRIESPPLSTASNYSPRQHTSVNGLVENNARRRRPVAADFVPETSHSRSKFGSDSCDNVIIELSDDEASISRIDMDSTVVEKPMYKSQRAEGLEPPTSVSTHAKRKLQDTEDEIKRMTNLIAQLEKSKKKAPRANDLHQVQETEIVEDVSRKLKERKLSELQIELQKSIESSDAINAIMEESRAVEHRVETELESIESFIFEKEARLAILNQDISHLELQLKDAHSSRTRLYEEKKAAEETLTTHSFNAEKARTVHEQKLSEVEILQNELACPPSATAQQTSFADVVASLTRKRVSSQEHKSEKYHPPQDLESEIQEMEDVQISSASIHQPVGSNLLSTNDDSSHSSTYQHCVEVESPGNNSITPEDTEGHTEPNSPVIYDQTDYIPLGVADAPIKPNGGIHENHNYISPLRTFKSFRFHPNYLRWVPSGYGSLTYSHNLNPNGQLCQFECSGGICNDDSCTSIHFDKIRRPDYEILIELGQAVEGQTEEEQLQYRNGLRRIITQMRKTETPDVNKIAKAIVDYRRQFLGVSDRVIVL